MYFIYSIAEGIIDTSRRFMEKNTGEQPAPKVYELIYPDIQVRQLMISILHKNNDSIKQLGRGLVELTLQDERLGSTERILWQKESSPYVKGTISTFTLEHFPPGDKKPSISFNTVVYPDHRSVPMYVKDGKGRTMNLTPLGRRTAHREALTVLTDLDPELAGYVLDRCTNNSFKKCVGAYILSKYAYEAENIELTDKVVDQAYIDHSVRVKHLTRAILAEAEATAAHPQPSYYEAVKEASETTPEPSLRHGQFAEVDGLVAADSVARDMGRKWKNILPPDTK